MGIPREDYDEDIHAFCGRCGVIMLMEHMECPVEGDGLYCDVCSEGIRFERMTQLEQSKLRMRQFLERSVRDYKRSGLSLNELVGLVSELYENA